jgi:polyribonucleotide nucleotidyltransferase
MKPEVKRYTAMVGGKSLVFETGKLAFQAGGAVTLQLDDMVLFCSATMSEEPRTGIDFFPLSVDYEERLYAGGRIPGSFFRREGRPSADAILTARLTDRPLRPLFPKDMRNDVQVIIYSLSSDLVIPIDVQAINVASAAVMISDIPWDGPVGAVRIGRVNGELIVNPTYTQMEESDLDLRVAGTRDALLMVECGASEISEEIIGQALNLAFESIQPIITIIQQMADEIGKSKSEYPSVKIEDEFITQISERAYSEVESILDRGLSRADQRAALNELRNQIVTEKDAVEDDELKKKIIKTYEKVHATVVRTRILEKAIRPDGRQPAEIRPIWCEIDLSPRAHGSGLFTRGETQVLTLTTLGTPRDAQSLDNLTPNESKRYMHHYNFPPFSTGETRPLRGTSRRETGHGALAERALLPVMPDEKEFPYTLRLVSECMSSNGSTSMASVCGSTLALMDTGVPIKAPVSGIAMGLITGEDGKYVILSDIQGLEDHIGDMDFKVAGTDKGITALQMDIKITGITADMMTEALQAAKKGRAHILNQMLNVIPAPHPDLKNHAPRITTVNISVEKIGAVIGPGGKTIRAIQEETGAKIDIEEDGTVFIATNDGESARMAREKIEILTEEVELGRIYTGRVVRTADFGAFVEILPGQDGMVHISQLDTEHIKRVEDVCEVGDEITVMVTKIDADGKVRLSRQAVLEGWSVEEAIAKDRSGGSSRRSGGGRSRKRSGRSSGNRDRNRRR